MIKSFTHKGLFKFFETGSTSGIQAKHAARLSCILGVLDAAQSLQDIALPSYDLHPLKGDKKGLWSIKVSGNWRIVFCFEEGDVYVVNYLDYH
jgi:proteic killer suppression protein